MLDSLKIHLTVLVPCVGLVLAFASVSHLASETLDSENRHDQMQQQTDDFEVGLQGAREDATPQSASQITFSGFDFSTTPAAHVEGTIETCTGDCTFLITFGDQAVILSRDTGGQITSSHIIPKSGSLHESLVTIDMSDIGVDLHRFPILSLSNQLLGFFETNDGQTVIIEGSDLVNQSMNSDEGSIGSVSSCATERVKRNLNCIDQGESDYISWSECDSVSCSDGMKTYANCESKSVTIEHDVVQLGFERLSKYGCEW